MAKKTIKQKYKKKLRRPEPIGNWYGEPNLGSYYDDNEIKAVVKVLKNSRKWHTGFGPNSEEINNFENAFAKYCGVKHAIAVSNNGNGFDMVLRSLSLSKKDEIILPALNYKAWYMALMRYDSKLVFCDINLKTMNIDPREIEKKINKNTRLICPVHFGGISCDEKLIDNIAREASKKFGTKIKVVYDAARAAGVNYRGSKVGSGGLCEIFSFHSAKLLTTLGEGGMITTNNSSLSKKLRDMRNYGGENDWGMNYRMSKVQASFGIEQLNRLDDLNKLRVKIANRRTNYLNKLKNILLPVDQKYSTNIFYLYPIMVSDNWGLKERNKIVKSLEKEYGIICATPKFINIRWKYIQKSLGIPELPKTEELCSKVFCPILHPKLNKKQELYINSAIANVIKSI